MPKPAVPWSEYDLPPQPVRRGGSGWLGWVLFVAVSAGVGAFVYRGYLPLRRERGALQAQVDEQKQREQRSKKELRETAAQLAELKQSHADLSGKLVHTQAERDKIESELKRIQNELTAKLEPEIQAGNVRIRRRGNDLVVDLSDKILFESGKPEVHENGQKVLGEVGPTLAQLKDYTLQVGGHTDSTRISSPTTQERFPTNWELSTARATNVVRFLEETGKLPGERLVAMGFAQYRPAASNATAAGRQQNRRIELVLARR
ncbi:MAG TPA: flagellar motor protein MotB [Polyangiaceae bacterium]|nr:flagellar motor protein MotB [Polyangiaceae bacterium]